MAPIFSGLGHRYLPWRQPLVSLKKQIWHHDDLWASVHDAGKLLTNTHSVSQNKALSYAHDIITTLIHVDTISNSWSERFLSTYWKPSVLALCRVCRRWWRNKNYVFTVPVRANLSREGHKASLVSNMISAIAVKHLRASYMGRN